MTILLASTTWWLGFAAIYFAGAVLLGKIVSTPDDWEEL